MIAVIDYGMGNLHSVEKALVRLGATVKVTSEEAEIRAAAGVILPGVGAFGDCMENLERSGLCAVIREVCGGNKPFLGICLGLQLLFDSSEEAPGVRGLGIVPGVVRKIVAPELKIPHMGWNSLCYATPSPLFANLDEGQHVYFVHSYHALPQDRAWVSATTEYGETVTAAIGQGNVQAVQFHPEKSGQVGLQILRNFIALTNEEDAL